jgi:hypothetical protein
MTTQAAINGQSFGTSTNVGNNKFSITPLTFGGTTERYVVSVKTVGAAGVLTPRYFRVWYATTPYSVDAANAPYHFKNPRYVDVEVNNGTVIIDSLVETCKGSKFHCWADAPKLEVAATLSVTLVELP